MRRLIDADKLIEKWNELSVRGRTGFDQVIMLMPTAYDVDKVISDIEDSVELIHVKHTSYYEIEEYIRFIDVIHIVREGGLDE